MKRLTTQAVMLMLGAAAAPAFVCPTAARAAQAQPSAPAADPAARANAAIEKGLAYLKTQQQPDGGWQAKDEPPAVTAVALRAFVRHPGNTSKTDFVARGYQKLLSYQLDNGGVYQDLLANYNTAIAVSALAAANDPAFQPRIDRAVAYLKGIQWTENAAGPGPKGEKVTDKSHVWYGGFGYSRAGRPDLSNAQTTLDALRDAGLKPDDPAFQAAVTFLSRVQNRSESNDQPFAADDGGFIYSPANKGESMAGEYTGPDGRRLLRSYGSMTYAGLKSMIYAGLTKDDARVKAAWDWIGKNWTLDENPGMKANNKPEVARNGLFYYYHTLARAMNAYDEPTITDAKGGRHDWRAELVDKLAASQAADGSWVGDKRWMEDKPVLATAYAVLALQEAVKDLKEHPAK